MADSSTPIVSLAYAQLILTGRVDRDHALERLLAALESIADLVPRRWGPKPFDREPYLREHVVAFARQAAAGEGIVHLRSHEPLAYLAHCYAAPEGGPLSTLDIRSTADYDPDRAEAFVAGVSELAGAVDLEFGSIDLRFVDQDPKTFMRSGVHAHPLGPYLQQGPDVVFPRTFFGPRLVRLLGGPALLEQSGGVVAPLGTSGAYVLDLVERPWSASPEDLKQAQIRIEKRLQLSGSFARPAGRWKTIAGPRWEPPSLS